MAEKVRSDRDSDPVSLLAGRATHITIFVSVLVSVLVLVLVLGGKSLVFDEGGDHGKQSLWLVHGRQVPGIVHNQFR